MQTHLVHVSTVAYPDNDPRPAEPGRLGFRSSSSVVNPRVADMARYVIDATTLVHVIESNSQIDSSHQLVAPNASRSQPLTLLLLAFRHGDYSETSRLSTGTADRGQAAPAR